jgi:hypothetical protein
VRRPLRTALNVAGAALPALAVAAAVAGCGGDSPPRADVVATVGSALDVRAIQPGFIGISMEYQSAAVVAGPASDPDTVVQQLITQMAPGQDPVIRIGGDSTDHAWWPAPGLRDPDRLGFPITPAWLASIRTLAQAVHARLVLGINLEADNARLSAIEARALVAGVGRASVQALELGNEPNLYASLLWYRTAAGTKVFGRPPGWSPAQYLAEFARVADALPSVPLAGPALGAPLWMSQVLQPLLRAQPRLTMVTYHRYPLDRCFTTPKEATYPTLANLMRPVSSRGLAATVAGYARTALTHGDVFRVDELNSVACSGKQGVSNTFASALWMLDTLFAMAREGVTGVNIHTLPSAAYRLFTVHHSGKRWSATVAPEYYALAMFTRAAPPGSRLLGIATRGSSELRAWATGGPGKPTRVVLINDSPRRTQTVQVRGAAGGGAAELQRLRAAGLRATGGVSLGGRSFADRTTTGVLAAPRQVRVPHVGASYTVVMPPASAALLTVAP